MNRGHEHESAGEQHETQTGKTRFAQPLDHASQNAGANEHAHSAEIHDEVTDICFRDRQTVGEQQR